MKFLKDKQKKDAFTEIEQKENLNLYKFFFHIELVGVRLDGNWRNLTYYFIYYHLFWKRY